MIAYIGWFLLVPFMLKNKIKLFNGRKNHKGIRVSKQTENAYNQIFGFCKYFMLKFAHRFLIYNDSKLTKMLVNLNKIYYLCFVGGANRNRRTFEIGVRGVLSEPEKQAKFRISLNKNFAVKENN